MKNEEALLTKEAVCEWLGGIHVNTLNRFIRLGELPVVRVGRRVMIDPRDLRDYIAARKTNVSDNDDGSVATEPFVPASADAGDGHDGS